MLFRSPEFIAMLRRLQPFGPKNPRPVFRSRGVADFGTSKLVGRQMEHIKLELVDDTCGKVFNGIAFNMAELYDGIHAGRKFDVCYTIEDNKHKGASGAIQLQVKEIVFCD